MDIGGRLSPGYRLAIRRASRPAVVTFVDLGATARAALHLASTLVEAGLMGGAKAARATTRVDAWFLAAMVLCLIRDQT